MGALFSEGAVGIWASNVHRNDFLDWFAENRCAEGDERADWCYDESQRWTGRCLELSEFLKPGECFEVTETEEASATAMYGAKFAKLLTLIVVLRRGDWPHRPSDPEAIRWWEHY